MVLSELNQARVKCTQEKTTIPWKTRRYFALFLQLFGALAAEKKRMAVCPESRNFKCTQQSTNNQNED